MAAVPALADDPGDDDDRNVWVGRKALRVVDCEDGEPCTRFVHLGGSGGFLGVSTQQLTPELRDFFGADEAGVLISKIVDGSPAEEAGLMVGDVIVAIDGEPVRSTGRLARMIRKVEDGADVDIEVLRERRAQVIRARIIHRARTTVDLSDFVDATVFESLEGLESLEALDLSGLADIGTVIGDSLGAIDWEQIGRSAADASVRVLDSEHFEEMMESLSDAFDSDAWQGYIDRIETMDFSELEARMETLRERMQELERELENKLDKNP